MIAWEIFSYGVVQGNCWSRLNCKKSYQKRSIFSGARFHSGLHVQQKSVRVFFRMTQEHRKGDLSLPPLTMLEVIKSKTFPAKHYPRPSIKPSPSALVVSNSGHHSVQIRVCQRQTFGPCARQPSFYNLRAFRILNSVEHFGIPTRPVYNTLNTMTIVFFSGKSKYIYIYGLLTKRDVKMAGYWPTRLISSHLDRTSLVNKGFII